jgi:hypothetical protein
VLQDLLGMTDDQLDELFRSSVLADPANTEAQKNVA